MKIIIIGAGDVGYHLSEILSGEGYDVTVIEDNERVAQRVDEELDVKVIAGSGAAATTLDRAEVDEADYVLAMTSDDRVNIVACSVAKYLHSKVVTIARVHDQVYSETSRINYQMHFGLDHILNPEALCAVELAKVIRNPGRVAVENFARGQIEVQRIRIHEKSKLIHRALKDIRLDPKVRIGFIQRNDSILLPDADTQLEPRDSVTFFGHPENLFELRPKLDPTSKVDHVRIVLYGGSETAISLVRLLNNPRFRIRIIEKEPTVARRLAENFPEVTVIQGDATSLRLLEEEQIDAADYFIGCTKKDEDNIMTCLQVAKLGASHVLLVINKQDYQLVLQNLRGTLGLEQVTSPRLATANEVLRILSREHYIELSQLEGGIGRILEVQVRSGCEVIGKAIKDIRLPRGAVIVALLHKFEARVPGAEDQIVSGDRIVTIVPQEQEKQLLRMFK